MSMEFRPVRCSIDPETGLFWVDDSLNYPRLMCEARTISALQRTDPALNPEAKTGLTAAIYGAIRAGAKVKLHGHDEMAGDRAMTPGRA